MSVGAVSHAGLLYSPAVSKLTLTSNYALGSSVIWVNGSWRDSFNCFSMKEINLNPLCEKKKKNAESFILRISEALTLGLTNKCL